MEFKAIAPTEDNVFVGIEMTIGTSTTAVLCMMILRNSHKIGPLNFASSTRIVDSRN